MSIEYRSGGRTYHVSYSDLQQQYERLVHMTDEQFLKSVPDALHLACVVGWMKEWNWCCLEDTGIIHQLVHLLTVPECESLHEIRDLFKLTVKLI